MGWFLVVGSGGGVFGQTLQREHFIPIQESIFAEKLVEIYVWEVVAHHGVLVSVVSDRDVRFTSRFWKRFHNDMGTRLQFSTTFHKQTDRQSKRTIQTLEDILL